MAFRIQPATDEFEPGVEELFTRARVTIDPAYWERAFSPQGPAGHASQPLVAVDHEEHVMGFAASRPVELFIEGEYVAARVLHDFVVLAGHLERDVAGLLIRDAGQGAEVTLAAGAGVELTRVLGQASFQHAGFFERYRFDPSGKGPRHKLSAAPMPLEPATQFPDEAASLGEMLATERRLFRRRTPEGLNWQFRGPARDYEVFLSRERGPCSAYAVLRRVEGRVLPELQLVDAACPSVDVKRLAAALAQLSLARGLPLYVSLIAQDWEAPLLEIGFEKLRPRWPLFWTLRDPRQRAMGGALLRQSAWFFTPADGEIDHW